MFALTRAAIPVMILCTVGAVLLVAAIALLARRRRVTRRQSLPVGAEAALLWVVEVLPDPRNHLAIKDPTSEMRLTEEERAAAAAAAATIEPRMPMKRPAELAAERRAADIEAAARRKDKERTERAERTEREQHPMPAAS